MPPAPFEISSLHIVCGKGAISRCWENSSQKSVLIRHPINRTSLETESHYTSCCLSAWQSSGELINCFVQINGAFGTKYFSGAVQLECECIHLHLPACMPQGCWHCPTRYTLPGVQSCFQRPLEHTSTSRFGPVSMFHTSH